MGNFTALLGALYLILMFTWSWRHTRNTMVQGNNRGILSRVLCQHSVPLGHCVLLKKSGEAGWVGEVFFKTRVQIYLECCTIICMFKQLEWWYTPFKTQMWQFLCHFYVGLVVKKWVGDANRVVRAGWQTVGNNKTQFVKWDYGLELWWFEGLLYGGIACLCDIVLIMRLAMAHFRVVTPCRLVRRYQRSGEICLFCSFI
jgi:hypothetical protein